MKFPYWDVGDEPSIEERVDIAFTQEGRAVFAEAAMLDERLTKLPIAVMHTVTLEVPTW